ncbi:MAG: hypothetical protein EP329_16855 [Deltaproteobacteria bacterium]|nr:MAG: hypothetical protein EP329_16855 [Deltaproteobacteria bacterium]
METWYELLGGEAPVRALVDRFYDLMDTLPEVAELRAMHPADLAGSRDKLYRFLVGWTGGPPLYVEKYGHPRLRARHMPFVIGDSARDQWMRCMTLAAEEQIADEGVRRRLIAALDRLAGHMRNSADG